jgi:hypothetical protein
MPARLAIPGRRAWIPVVIAGVPIALGLVWTQRTRPPDVSCEDDVTHAIRLGREAWLQGARPAFVVGALLVLAAIVGVSAWRGGGRPGVGAIVAAVMVGVYVLACAVESKALALIMIAMLVCGYFWWIAVPVMAAALATYLFTRSPGARPLAAVAALGWCSLVFAVGGLTTYVVWQASDPICLG